MDSVAAQRTYPSARATWWQRGLVVLAALAAAAAATWAVTEAPVSADLYVPWPAVALVPVFLPRHSFRRACFAVGAVLMTFGVVGALWGLFIFIPTGLAVLIVGTTGGAFSWPCGILSALISVATLAGAVSTVVSLYAPPDMFIVQFNDQQYDQHEGMLDRLAANLSPLGHGVTEVNTSVDDSGPEWDVFFATDLSSVDQEALRTYLGTLPGVVSVEYCVSPYQCGR